MRKYLLYFIIILLLFFAVVRIVGRRSSYARAELMGTWVEVKGKNASLAISEIRRLDNLLSHFNPGSEVSRINRAAGKHPVKVSKDTYQIIAQAYQLSKLSRGAFDITLGKKGDYRNIVLNPNLSEVYLPNPGMKIDLGAIGKGYAVESARKVLLARGTRKALIDMHSSIAAIGGPWKIGILDPRPQITGRRAPILGKVILKDGEALSTSGLYEQPGHIIDPRTGKPADKCLSVTLVAQDASLADALSTAVFVLGPEEGMELIESLPGIEGLIVDSGGKIVKSSGFNLK